MICKSNQELTIGSFSPNHDEMTFRIDLWYPQCEGNAKSFTIGLMANRAADDIRVSYDFDRDGWKIEQNSHAEDPIETTGPDDWQEVSFVHAWQRIRATTGQSSPSASAHPAASAASTDAHASQPASDAARSGKPCSQGSDSASFSTSEPTPSQ